MRPELPFVFGNSSTALFTTNVYAARASAGSDYCSFPYEGLTPLAIVISPAPAGSRNQAGMRPRYFEPALAGGIFIARGANRRSRTASKAIAPRRVAKIKLSPHLCAGGINRCSCDGPWLHANMTKPMFMPPTQARARIVFSPLRGANTPRYCYIARSLRAPEIRRACAHGTNEPARVRVI